MKNNRAIRLDTSFIEAHQLSTSSPHEDSLFWKMWNMCTDIAEHVLQTDFIQGIKKGTLDPVVYGSFNISDAYYCFHGSEDYLKAATKASHPTLQAFLSKKHSSYQQYNETFPKVWRVKDADGIVPSETCKRYSDFESHLASLEDPIYALIAMIPCEYLWAWLGTQLSPPTAGNLYAPWINGNNSPDGAYAMGNFIESYRQEYPIDETLAITLYTQAMNFEYENFQSATRGEF